MRESTRVLVEDLEKEKQTEKVKKLLEDAKADHFHDFFGKYAAPQHVLMMRLKEAKLHHLISNVINGKYDGTKVESEEWMSSPEGQETFAELKRWGRKNSGQ